MSRAYLADTWQSNPAIETGEGQRRLKEAFPRLGFVVAEPR